jgi:hypothetical protein
VFVVFHVCPLGQVWVCSGQSNMQYPVGKPGCWNPINTNCTAPSNDPQCVCSPRGEYPGTPVFPHGCGCINQTGAEVVEMANFSQIRLLQIFPSSAPEPLLEAENSGWRTAPQLANQDSANFSAVCWLFGRDLQRALHPPRPLGLVEASLGGTPIQAWSSADALGANCSVEAEMRVPNGSSPLALNGSRRLRGLRSSSSLHSSSSSSSLRNGGLWNGLIEPLLRSTIYGAIWCKLNADHTLYF